jgi:exonuclease VII small subunit
MKKEATPEEFIAFFKMFTSSMRVVKEEFKNKIEPAIYFNPDNKKLAEKSAAFMAIFDEIENGISTVEGSLNNDRPEDFEKGYRLILQSTEKLNTLRGEITEIMKTMSPT